MNGAKGEYSAMVVVQKKVAKNDPELNTRMNKAHGRKERFWPNWEKVNLNELVEKFTPGAVPHYNDHGDKVVFSNPKTKIDLVCDVAGGYVRIQDMSVEGKQQGRKYLDINGKELNTVLKPNGKQRGLTGDEQKKLSHFLIKKLSEMEEK